jgi:hypothetical protein
VDALSEQPRVIAEVREYGEFTAALRKWIYELDTNYTCVNDLAGLQDGYLAKLLARTPSRNFGRTSLGNVLGALGLRLLLVVDTESLAKMRPRYKFLKALKAATVEYRAAEQKAVRELRELDAARSQHQETIARERRDLERAQAAWAAEEGRRRLQLEQDEALTAKLREQAERKHAEAEEAGKAVSALRAQLQHTIDKIAA